MNIGRKHIGRTAAVKSLCLLLLLPAHCRGGGAVLAAANSIQAQIGRYVALTDAAAAAARAGGAKVVLETHGLTAVICAPGLAKSLGLVEDIRMQAMDSPANSQVLATRLQDMGLTGRGRTVVVLDSGYNYNHPELSSSYLGGRDFVNHDDDPFDDNGHGSHVAGIITGDGVDPRARGIAPDTGIVAGKVLDSFGLGYTSDLVNAIYWAVDGPDGIFGDYDDFSPDAINISIGALSSDSAPSGFCDGTFPPLTYAIKYAVDHRIAVVVAAGNNGSSGVAFPGCISYAITVGAIDTNSVHASFSGIGPAVGLAAPGVGLYSAYLGNAYKVKDGTSQATPVVTGTIALLKQAFPEARPDEIENALFVSAHDLGDAGRDSRYGWGRVDAWQALGVLTTNLENVALHLGQSNGQVVVSWPVTFPGFVVQASSRLDGTTNGWVDVTNSIVAVGDENGVLVPMPGRVPVLPVEVEMRGKAEIGKAESRNSDQTLKS